MTNADRYVWRGSCPAAKGNVVYGNDETLCLGESQCGCVTETFVSRGFDSQNGPQLTNSVTGSTSSSKVVVGQFSEQYYKLQSSLCAPFICLLLFSDTVMLNSGTMAVGQVLQVIFFFSVGDQLQYDLYGSIVHIGCMLERMR